MQSYCTVAIAQGILAARTDHACRSGPPARLYSVSRRHSTGADTDTGSARPCTLPQPDVRVTLHTSGSVAVLCERLPLVVVFDVTVSQPTQGAPPASLHGRHCHSCRPSRGSLSTHTAITTGYSSVQCYIQQHCSKQAHQRQPDNITDLACLGACRGSARVPPGGGGRRSRSEGASDVAAP